MKLSNYYTQAKHLHSWTTLRISRPFFKGTLEGNLVPRAFIISVKRIGASGNERFVGSYCRSRGGLSANQKEEHFASNDNGRRRRVAGLKVTSCPRRSWIVWFKMSPRTSSNKMKLVRELKIGLFCEVFP